MLAKIAKYGGFPVSVTLGLLGTMSLAREAATWGIPALIWFIACYIVLLLTSLSIIWGLWRENKILSIFREQERNNDIRDERKRYREAFINKRHIPDKLFELDKYFAKRISEQNVSGVVFLSVLKRWFVWYEFPYLILITITWSTAITRRIFKMAHFNFVIGRANKVNAILQDYKLGTWVIIEEDGYKSIYDEIRELEVGLPPNVTNKINRVIALSVVLHSLKLLNLKQSVWKKFSYPRIMEPLIIAMRIGLQSCSGIVDNAMSSLQAGVAKDIEEYFLGVEI